MEGVSMMTLALLVRECESILMHLSGKRGREKVGRHVKMRTSFSGGQELQVGQRCTVQSPTIPSEGIPLAGSAIASTSLSRCLKSLWKNCTSNTGKAGSRCILWCLVSYIKPYMWGGLEQVLPRDVGFPFSDSNWKENRLSYVHHRAQSTRRWEKIWRQSSLPHGDELACTHCFRSSWAHDGGNSGISALPPTLPTFSHFSQLYY